MAVATMVSSAGGLLAMLNENHPQLKLHALSNLNKCVDFYWPEISTSVPIIESLYEDEEFDQHQRQLAALLVSKVFYYLGELNDSLSYSLGAGSLFDVSEESDYVHTLLAKAIDEYASLKSKAAAELNEAVDVDPRLEAIVERMLDKCINDGKYQQAMGISIECRRLDKLEEAITRSDNVQGSLSYCINVSHSFVYRRQYRHEVLRLLVNIYRKLPSPDYLSICQCLMFLDDPEAVVQILEKLLRSNQDDTLLAFQIAFDLVENEHQAFLLNVRDRFSVSKAQPVESVRPASEAQDPAADVTMTDGAPSSNASTLQVDPFEVAYADRIKKIRGILSGETSIQLTLQFLYSHNNCDTTPFLALPLREMEERYTRGTKVEVLNMNDPPFGSWRCGEIVYGDGQTYLVRYYSSNSANMGDTLERVSHNFIRPYPPLLDISKAWAPGELVEVFDNFTWRMGSVSRALGRNCFLVWLLGFSEVLRASSSNIRARRSWQDDMWTLIGPGSSTIDRTNSVRHREIIDAESFDVSGERSRASSRQDLKHSLMILVPRYPKRGSPYVDSRSEEEHNRTIIFIPPARPSLKDDVSRSIQSYTSSCSIKIHDRCREPPSGDILSAHSSDAESSCYENCWQGNEEADAEVRRLELHAYHCTMEALGTSGTLTWEQESMVTNLRMLLHISNDEHLSKLRQLVHVDRQMRVS